MGMLPFPLVLSAFKYTHCIQKYTHCIQEFGFQKEKLY